MDGNRVQGTFGLRVVGRFQDLINEDPRIGVFSKLQRQESKHQAGPHEPTEGTSDGRT